MVARRAKMPKNDLQNLAKQFSVLSIQKPEGLGLKSHRSVAQNQVSSVVLQNPAVLQMALNLTKIQTRSVTKFSLFKGKASKFFGTC